MILSPIVALLLQAATTAPHDRLDERLEAARIGFASPKDHERRAAARVLLRELLPQDVDAALAAVATWPPTSSMLLRETLTVSGRARATLLERATRPRDAALARALLIDAFVARAAAAAPFRAEAQPEGDDPWPLADRGVWLARTDDARAGWSWFELDDLLEREGVLERTLVPTADCADLLVAAPIAARVPAEGWFGVAAERASLVCVPLAVGAWIVSRERAEQLMPGGTPGVGNADDARGDRMPARVLEIEAGLLDGELAAASRSADVRRGVVAGDLMRRAGLDVGADEVGSGAPHELDFATGLALVRAARGLAPIPNVELAIAADPVVAAFLRIARARSATIASGADGSNGTSTASRIEARAIPPDVEASARLLSSAVASTQRDPAALASRPAAEVREVVARMVELTRGRTERAHDLLALLRPLVDTVAGRCFDDPLLGGQLVELLRREEAATATREDEKRALATIARELGALNRGTRPPTRLLLLPPGVAR